MWRATLLFIPCVFGVAWGSCNGSNSETCRNPDDGDGFAALQIGRHAGHALDGSLATDEQEWRDAIDVEREFFTKHAALIEKANEGQTWSPPSYPKKPPPVFIPPWFNWFKSPVFSSNAQANPARPPYGPFSHSPFEANDPPSEKLQNQIVVRSENGILVTTLVIEPGWVEVPGTGLRVYTRLYNGSYPGPTIRVKRGDLVNITVINKLGKQNPPETWQRREGQATNEYPRGIPPDNPRYQDIGQSPDDPFKMRAKTNNMHDVNSTNLHVHGWHVSPLVPQDNVLDVKIDPGDAFTYSYQLSPYHSSGNSWYHGHWHGSVTSHTNGGMVGALIVDDEIGESPDWIRNAREELLVIHEADWSYYGPKWLGFYPEDSVQGCFPFGSTFTVQCALGHRTGLMANLSGDMMYRMQYKRGFGYEVGDKVPITSVFTVNGQYRPYFEIPTGEWIRLRVIFASGNLPINMVFNESSPCEMWLVSKDSAWVNEYPRKLSRGMFFGAGNRAQAMIRCSEPGTFAIHNNFSSYAFSAVDPNQTFAFVKVSGPKRGLLKDPEIAKAMRPRYLQSLVELKDDEIFNPFVPPATNQYNHEPVDVKTPVKVGKTIAQVMTYDFPGGSPGLSPIPATAYMHQPVRFVINNMTFSHELPQATFPVGKVIEVEAAGLDTHSWHMHTNPVQFVSFGTENYREVWGGYFEIGDWQDVLQLTGPSYDVREAATTAKVRFQTDCYKGAYVVHCHVLYHEDLGMMTWFNVTGEDHTYNPSFKNEGVFAHPPSQCMKPGQECAPAHCTDFKYARRR